MKTGIILLCATVFLQGCASMPGLQRCGIENREVSGHQKRLTKAGVLIPVTGTTYPSVAVTSEGHHAVVMPPSGNTAVVVNPNGTHSIAIINGSTATIVTP